MPTAFVNHQEVEFTPGMTVLQVCEQAAVEVPRFCYHERLQIAGNCRMCLVEIEGGPPKPAASCAMPAGDGMKIHTNTPMVKKAREGVMEFLLINHPLDCPICDQGGECDLQDQAMAFGCGESRFDEQKRGVKDKYIGPLIKTHMTRCIHCTRCVRFMEEVAGTSEMGAFCRGEHTEIGTFIENTIHSELSGNIVDLCPVGALTNRPYAHKARSWELTHTETVDVMDAVGSNIRVDAKGNEVLRVLPRLHEDINEEWISDVTRHACDGLKYQRLDRPYLRRKGKLEAVDFDTAYQAIVKKLKKTEGAKIGAIAGDLVDTETMWVAKQLLKELGSPHMDCRQDGALHDASNPGSYRFNTTISGIEEADACLIIGANPRLEAPLLNARIRKRSLQGNFPIALVGDAADLTYEYTHLGTDAAALESLKGKLPKAKRPMVIVGNDVLKRSDAKAVLEAARALVPESDDWNGFNVLQKAANRVGGLEAGFVPGKGGKDVAGMLNAAEKGEFEVLFLFGADEIDVQKAKKSFVVYIGHHGDAGASVADVILPAPAYTEKSGLYVNLEGRAQLSKRATFPLGEAREDWRIVSELGDYLKIDMPYHSIAEVRAALAAHSDMFVNLGQPTPAKVRAFKPGKAGFLKAPFAAYEDAFYQSNAIARASRTMAACVEEFIDAAAQKKVAA